MATAKDQQDQIDALKRNVGALQARVAALGSGGQPVPQLIAQEQLDANVADLAAANDAVNKIAPNV